MAAGASQGGTPARVQFVYRPWSSYVNVAALILAEDASTPAIVTGSGSANPTTASFSPPANSLLVALVGGGFGSTLPTRATVTDTLGHAWTTGVTATGTVASTGGVALIAYTYLSTAPGPMMVTATFTNLSGGYMLAVRVLNNASPSQYGAGTGITLNTANTTAATVSVTTTNTGSLVYGVTDLTNQDQPLTANGATTIINSYLDSTDTIGLFAWKASTLTGTPGATTLGGSWAGSYQSNIAALEILPSSAPLLYPPPPPALVLSQAVMRAAFF